MVKVAMQALGLLMVASTGCMADEYHYNNLLVGGEAIGMAGAYTALSHDLSSLHYNPSAIVHTHSSSTASVNTLAWEQTDFRQVFGNGDDFYRDSFAIIPGFVSVKKQLNQWHLGAAFAVTDFSKERSVTDAFYIAEDGSNSKVNEFANINIDNSVYQLTLAAARALSESISLGVSLAVKYREFETLQGSGTSIETPLNEQQWLLTGFDARRRFDDIALNVEPAISMFAQGEHWSFGAKIAHEVSLNRVYRSTSTIIVNQPQALPGQLVSTSRIKSSHDAQQKYPLQLSLGTAYREGDFTLSFDLNYFTHVARDTVIVDEQGSPITREYGAVTNYAAGVKYRLSEQCSFTFGVFTDNSNGVINTNVDFERIESIDLVGYSMAFEFENFTFGGYYKQGSGQVRLADIRVVEKIVGAPLYHPNDNFDIAEASKNALVVYLSLDF